MQQTKKKRLRDSPRNAHRMHCAKLASGSKDSYLVMDSAQLQNLATIQI